MSRMRVPSWSTRLFVISMIAASPLAAQPARRRPPRPVVVRPSPTARVCLPGAQVTCACPGTSAGVQVCNASGTGLEPCVCAAASPAPTPTPTPTGLVAQARVEPVARPGGGDDHGAGWTRTSHWYGWQTLVMDLGAIGVGSIGIATESTPVYVTGGVLQLLGPPIVHWSHGNVGAGFGSLGVRFLGGVIGTVGLLSTDPDKQKLGLGLGLGIQVLAIILDAAAFAREDVWVRAGGVQSTAQRRGLAWSMGVSPLPGGVLLGVGGTL